jgi:uncharacterized damage-inducible protein DinB
MKRSMNALVLSLLLLVTAATGQGQEAKGFLSDLTGQMEYVQKQVLDLEGSIPDKKMAWRPNKDVRSVSEVYLHIAYDNYFIAKMAGITPPADFPMASPEDATKWEKASTDKKVIREHLMKSFDFVKNGLKNLPDGSLDNTVDFFGNKMTVRSTLMILLTHVHEHLGQSIAYARMVGVVPPWTAAQMAASKAKK